MASRELGDPGRAALEAVEEELRPGGDTVTILPRPRVAYTALVSPL